MDDKQIQSIASGKIISESPHGDCTVQLTDGSTVRTTLEYFECCKARIRNLVLNPNA